MPKQCERSIGAAVMAVRGLKQHQELEEVSEDKDCVLWAHAHLGLPIVPVNVKSLTTAPLPCKAGPELSQANERVPTNMKTPKIAPLPQKARAESQRRSTSLRRANDRAPKNVKTPARAPSPWKANAESPPKFTSLSQANERATTVHQARSSSTSAPGGISNMLRQEGPWYSVENGQRPIGVIGARIAFMFGSAQNQCSSSERGPPQGNHVRSGEHKERPVLIS